MNQKNSKLASRSSIKVTLTMIIGLIISLMVVAQSSFSEVSNRVTKEEYQEILKKRLKKSKLEAKAIAEKLKKLEGKKSIKKTVKKKVKKRKKLTRLKAKAKSKKKLRLKKRPTKKKLANKKIRKKLRKKKKRYKRVKNTKGKKLKLSATAATSKKLAKKVSTTTKKADAVKPEVKTPWSFSALYAADIASKGLSDGTGSLGGYLQAKAGYKLKSGLSLAVAPTFGFNYSLETGSATGHSIGDVLLDASKGGLFEVAGFSVWGRGRFYVPVGESSRNKGTKGALRGTLSASRSFGKVGLSYTLDSRYYVQSQRALVTFDELDRVLAKPKPLPKASIYNGLGASYGLTDSLGLSSNLGVSYAMLYDDPGVGLVDPVGPLSLSLGFELGLSVGSHVGLSLGIGQSHDISSKSTTGFKFLNGEETAYSFSIAIY